MKKNLLLTGLTFLGLAFLETIINQFLLKGIYTELNGLWRTSEELGNLAPIFMLIYLVVSLGFASIFLRAYAGGGILEGVKIGFMIGVISRFWYAYTNFIVLPIPHTLAIQWFLFGLIEMMLLGMVCAMLVDKLAKKA
ncbi:hypothetical protein EHQ58_03710 [Leptospira ognonensis]|uniref:Uncharacterized protein n=1 Tax=Leptospira ognonensis TaxID=2484945 RepID=A0A4R9K7N4_9LEPT|nr:hypothetical protein [Leptospira ognonensis]TGL62315.1 hypothetical protein EHQ58_03710 [Leptospira ognonensis]